MLRLRDIMTKEVVTVSPDLSIRDAMDLLSSRHLSGVPVVRGEEIVGVVSTTDLLAFAASLPGTPEEQPGLEAEAEEEESESEEVEESDSGSSYFTEMWSDSGAESGVRFQSEAAPEWNVLEEHTVSEAMTRAPIIKLAPDTPVVAAAEFMKVHAVHRVLVTDGPKLLGIVSVTDVSNAVAEHKLTSRTYVFDGKANLPGQEW